MSGSGQPGDAGMTHRHHVAIIGAGPGGICAGVRLLEAGCRDFIMIDQASNVGGTWYHNRYPGAECDVMSHLYSFSFELNPDWSQRYARQPEIKEYLERCVKKYGLEPHLRLGSGVTTAGWDEERAVWRLQLANGDSYEANAVISAVGMFNEPSWPDIAGLDEFAGTTFHSARWPESHDLAGERVAVIGSAASAVQLVPEVAPIVERLFVFQRSATWVLPKDDRPYTDQDRERFRNDPNAMSELRRKLIDNVNAMMTFSDPEARRRAEAAGLENLAVVADEDTRRALLPKMPWGARRPIVSNVYYPTFNRDNVELVATPIERITQGGIRTVDGRSRDVDTIVLATGFATTKYLAAIDVVGRDGRRLQEEWSSDPRAYLGVCTAGFPNIFMCYGPNTNNGSIISMIECQVEYAVRMITWMDETDAASMEVRQDVMDAYNESLQDELDTVEVWQGEHGGYYRGGSGRIVTQWPNTMENYCARLRADGPESFHVVPRRRA
jgi:cation diffusion facilitator CzcD-associated flavoprotein CzcO